MRFATGSRGRKVLPRTDSSRPRGPLHLLWWLVVDQRRRVLGGAIISSIWMVLLIVPPYLVQRAIDDGLRTQRVGTLVLWCTAILVTGSVIAVLDVMKHRTMSMARAHATVRTVQVLTRAVVRLGPRLHRHVAAGEIVTIGGADITQIARTITIAGPSLGGLFAYVVVAVVLSGISPLLAMVVLLGVPTTVLLLVPLLRRLQVAESPYRERQGELTAMAGDIVTGLRVLCGVGGKELFANRYLQRSRRLRADGYRVSVVASWIEALAIGLPALYLAVVTWLAARMAAEHEISVGNMVAVHGYVAALSTAISSIIKGADDLGRCLVLGRRLVGVLDLSAEVVDTATGRGPRGDAVLTDPESGLTMGPGSLMAVACPRTQDAVEIFHRMVRQEPTRGSWGGIPLSDIDQDVIRQRILLEENNSYLFGGSIVDIVLGPALPDEARLRRALHCAAAEDIPAGLVAGVDHVLPDQALTLSGGQRQRLRLARALYQDAEVLLMVEPTSALDAHTESLIVARLPDIRAGRTTVVATSSPQVLASADTVAFVRDGRVVRTGSHAELVQTEPAYRALILEYAGEQRAEIAQRGTSA